MKVRNDVLLDSKGDLLIVNGDFFVGNSDQQNVELLFVSFPGQWRQFPNVGIGIKGDINGLFDDSMKNRIKTQLSTDGYTDVSYDFKNNKINVII